jgi:predicted O-methyltransferase YrrM
MGIRSLLRKRMDARGVHARQELRQRMPDTVLSPEHVVSGRLLPDRMALLDTLPKNMTIAEIGVANGDFSAEILARCRPKRLHLVDAWHTDRYAQGEAYIRSRFAAEISNSLVVLNKGLSTEVLREFDDSTFDFVYIDTDHSYQLTSEELKRPGFSGGGFV